MANGFTIAIETSGRAGSVALARDSEILGQHEFKTDRDHAKDLLPAVDGLCRQHRCTPADIRECFISVGPGSFTGLRVAVTFARSFALATGAKICAVPTLDVIAENCIELPAPPPHVAVVLDAKRRQVFGAIYKLESGVYQRLGEPRMIAAAELIRNAPSPIVVTGEGIPYHREAIDATGVEIAAEPLWRPLATMVHRLGRKMADRGLYTDPHDLVPYYVRRPEAEELWEKRHGKSAAE